MKYATAISVGSFVIGGVGYMSGKVSKNKVEREFKELHPEFRCRVESIFEMVTEMFSRVSYNVQTDIIRVNDFERICSELMEFAVIKMVGIAESSLSKYKEYEDSVCEAQYWYVNQNDLLIELRNISELRRKIIGGDESNRSVLHVYEEKVKDALHKLNMWHMENCKKFKINVNDDIRRRMGIDFLLHCIPGVFDNELNYKDIDEYVTGCIFVQKRGKIISLD